MPYYRSKYYGKRKYYKKRSRSVKAVTTSRAFKASAANMTQNGRFNISVKDFKTVQIAINTNSAMVDYDIGNILVQAPMHDQLSKVFDQYKIEKMTLKFNLVVNNPVDTAENISHVCFFTAIDRTGFAANATPYSIRTYGSYKESTWSTNGDTNPPHYVTIGQADLVSKSEYYDTKHIAAFPKMKIGFDAIQTLSAGKTFTVTCEIDACVRYRGVRLDTSGVYCRRN